MNIATALAYKYQKQPKSFLLRVEIRAAEEADAAGFDKAKAFLKKALIPALMLLGPVACGQQEPGEDKAAFPKAEQQVNTSLSSQKIKCKITPSDDKMTWTFTDSTGDKVVFEHPIVDDAEAIPRNALEVVQEPKSERMQDFMDAAMDTFEFGFKHMKEKYECDIKVPKGTMAPTQPNLP